MSPRKNCYVKKKEGAGESGVWNLLQSRIEKEISLASEALGIDPQVIPAESNAAAIVSGLMYSVKIQGGL